MTESEQGPGSVNRRLDRLRAVVAEQGLDGLIVSRTEDQRYITGFSGHADYDSVLLVAPRTAGVVTDSRYWQIAEEQAPSLSLIKLQAGKYQLADAVKDFSEANGLKTIGFEAHHVTFHHYTNLKKAARKAHVKLKPVQDLVKNLRALKDEGEIEQIRRAVDLTDAALSHFLTRVRPGMTEKQAAWIIEAFMREHGAEGNAFDPIVASGPNAALPHAELTDRALEEGEPITIDIGARLAGYNADLTRTITLGYATDKFRKIYGIVLKAQLAVEKKARIGMTGKQVDRIARRVIEKAGYGNEFGHGTGHGVGLAVHEFPRAGRASRDRIAENMTLTVEPGIYLPGWGGVRIEDLVVFRREGIEVLSHSGKDPVVVNHEEQ